MEKLENATFYDQAFEWRFEFPEVLDEDGNFTGFDAVIGNPPYVRVQKLNHNLIDWFKENKETAFRRIDISLFFFELGKHIARRNGIITYISSNQFLSTRYGKKLREFIANRLSVYKMIDLGDLPIFEEALTYVSIFILENKEMSDFLLSKINSIGDAKNINNTIFEIIDSRSIKGDEWLLKNKQETSLFEKIRSFNSLSEHLGKCHYGIITGNDTVFNIDNDKISHFNLEKELVYPLIRASNCQRYGYADYDNYVIYPYDSNGDLMTEKKLKSKYPNTYSYLKDQKDKLVKRKDSRKTFENVEGWYKLTRHGDINVFKKKKIVFPGENKKNKFGIDANGSAYSGARVFSITLEKKDNINYVLGVLNSKLVEYYLHSTCPLKQGGYYSYSATSLDNLPVPKKTQSCADSIATKVGNVLSKKKADSETDTSQLEEEINQLVYELYGLSEEEIGIVEESVS